MMWDFEQNLFKSYDTSLPQLVLGDKLWYHGVLSQQESEKRMGKMDMNTFLVRESVQDKGNLLLSVKNGDKCYHFPIDYGVGKYEIHGTHTPFSSVPELVKYYMQNGLSESSGGELIQLILPCTFGVRQPVRPRKKHSYEEPRPPKPPLSPSPLPPRSMVGCLEAQY
jgi:hypothetical protein